MATIKYYWSLFCFAIKGAWGFSQLGAGILAIAGGYVGNKHPEWGATANNLLWMIPLVIFIGLFVIRLIIAIIKPPIDEIYRQILTTGTATVQWIAESKSNTISSLLLGHLTLEKGQKIFLGMRSIGNTESKQIGNDRKSYEASFELDIMGESIGKPICHLAQADIARIYLENLKDMMPLKSKIISGLVIFTFNSSVRIKIPILYQIMNGDEIIITEIGKYFKKES